MSISQDCLMSAYWNASIFKATVLFRSSLFAWQVQSPTSDFLSSTKLAFNVEVISKQLLQLWKRSIGIVKNIFKANYCRWWFHPYVFMFTPKIGEDEPILTIHIFQLSGSTTNPLGGEAESRSCESMATDEGPSCRVSAACLVRWNNWSHPVIYCHKLERYPDCVSRFALQNVRQISSVWIDVLAKEWCMPTTWTLLDPFEPITYKHIPTGKICLVQNLSWLRSFLPKTRDKTW